MTNRIVVAVILFQSMSAFASADWASYLANNATQWEISVRSRASQLAPIGDELIFSVPVTPDPDSNLREQALYRTDGSQPVWLGNIARTDNFSVARDRVFYLNRSWGSNIASTDGNSLNNVAVGPLSYWDFDIPIRTFVQPFGPELLFRSYSDADGWQVRQTDGTTVRSFDFPETLKSISSFAPDPDAPDSYPTLPLAMGQIGGQALVSAETKVRDCAELDNHCVENERALYTLDETGHQLLRFEGEALHSPRTAVTFGGEKYFFANTEAGGRGLFRTDGQTQTRIFQFRREHENVLATKDRLFFMAELEGTVRKSLYSTDGSDLVDYGFEMLNGNQAQILAELNGEIYFVGSGKQGSGVYRTDGDGTRFLQPIKLSWISRASQFALYDDHMYFPVENGIGKTNGEEVSIIETNGGQRLSRAPFAVGVSGGSLFFAAEGPNDIGMELLKITGDNLEWIDIDPNPNGSGLLNNFGITEFDGDIFFNDSTRERSTFVIDNGEVTRLGDVKTWTYENVLYLADFSTPDTTRISMVRSEITALGLPADFDDNGTVDLADFLVLSSAFGNSVSLAGTDPDIDGSGIVDFADFLILSGTFGQTSSAAATVPEPSASMMLASCLIIGCFLRRRKPSAVCWRRRWLS